MSSPWRMLRTAPEQNGAEHRTPKSGRRKSRRHAQRQKIRPMPEDRRQLQKKQRRCGGSPRKEGPLPLFVCGQKHREGRAASGAPGIGERGVLSSGGKGVPTGNGNPLSGMIPVKKEEGDREREELRAGDAEPDAVKAQKPWKKPQEQKKQEEGAKEGDESCPVSPAVGREPDCGEDVPAAEQKAKSVEPKPMDREGKDMAPLRCEESRKDRRRQEGQSI